MARAAVCNENEISATLFSPRSHLRGQVISAVPNTASGGQSLPEPNEARSRYISRAVSSANYLRSGIRRIAATKETEADRPERPSPTKPGARTVWSARPHDSALRKTQPFTLTSPREHDSLPPPPPSIFTAHEAGLPGSRSRVKSAVGGGFQRHTISPSSLPPGNLNGPDTAIFLQQLMQDLEAKGGEGRLELFHRPQSWATELPPCSPYPHVEKSLRGRPPSSSHSPFVQHMNQNLKQRPMLPPSVMSGRNQGIQDDAYGSTRLQ